MNLSICGAGTANRSLSALLMVVIYLQQNLEPEILMYKKFKNQIFVSNESPFEKLFYKDLEKFIQNIFPVDNTKNT